LSTIIAFTLDEISDIINWFKITVDKNKKLCMKTLLREINITFLCDKNV